MNQEKKQKNFSERLKFLIDQDGSSKSSIAHDVGVTSVSLSRYLAGRVPDAEILMKLSSRLKSTSSWLLTGEGDQEPVNKKDVEKLRSSTNIISQELMEIPVLSWAHAGQAMCYDEMPKDYMEPMTIPHRITNGCKAFGLIIDGDSMEPVIEHGDRIAVLHGAEPRNGCLVVAKFKQDEGVQVRRYVILSAPNGKPEKIKLIPYNNLYPATEHHISEFAWIMPVAAMMRHFW